MFNFCQGMIENGRQGGIQRHQKSRNSSLTSKTFVLRQQPLRHFTANHISTIIQQIVVQFFIFVERKRRRKRNVLLAAAGPLIIGQLTD
uniref:Uncharacterized protein n=1 Tax=Romanomermis culicivorax TaxID=13658 RepID=A0A915ID98_ROMCU